MFKKILIANRGEIACRIIKTAHRLGITTLGLYESADQNSLHRRLADEAEPCDYLNIPCIIDIALKNKVEAIHPGYGFFIGKMLIFAKACQEAGLVFIGPSPDIIAMMGCKQLAKQTLAKMSIPLVPGYDGQNQDDHALTQEAHKLGYPLLIKAAKGGGGKGLRAVYHADNFQDALLSARREAQTYFGDGTLLLETLLVNPRHIEVQILGDKYGHVVHLFERDCSIQRRHQKIMKKPLPLILHQHLKTHY